MSDDLTSLRKKAEERVSDLVVTNHDRHGILAEMKDANDAVSTDYKNLNFANVTTKGSSALPKKKEPTELEPVLIHAQNVHDYFMLHFKEHGWEDLKSFTCARPSFKKMVITYDHEFFNDEGRNVRHVDVLVTQRTEEFFSWYLSDEARIGDTKDLHQMVEATQPAIYLEIQLGVEAKLIPGRWFVFLDERGSVLSYKDIGWVFIKSPEEDKIINASSKIYRRDMQEALQDAMCRHGAITLATLQFLNCKNVEVLDNPPTRQQRRQAEREGKKSPIIYKTLLIHPFGKKRRVVRDSSGTPLANLPLHICRGHFKTYAKSEDGSGGLGKFHTTGTWWWSPQVRGTEAIGKVVKDYEVAEK